MPLLTYKSLALKVTLISCYARQFKSRLQKGSKMSRPLKQKIVVTLLPLQCHFLNFMIQQAPK